MSLGRITNEELISDRSHRWPRFCVDFDIWELPKIINQNRFADWVELKFTEENYSEINHLKNQEGIYMFVIKPNDMFSLHHSFIMYIGETKDLARRYSEYLKYKDSTHPSDFKKRKMTVIWKDYLYFNYFPTSYGSTAERRKEEYDLIDSIVPPINDDFRSDIIKEHVKSIRQ